MSEGQLQKPEENYLPVWERMQEIIAEHFQSFPEKLQKAISQTSRHRLHPAPATYILECLHSADEESRRRIGDMAMKELQKIDIPVSGENALLLSELLLLLGALPVSDKTTLIGTLDALRKDDSYRGFPSKSTDIHRSSILAISNHLYDGEQYENWHAELRQDLSDPAYVLSSYCVLIKASLTRALQELPEILGVLGKAKMPSRMLLMFLAYHIEQSREDISLILRKEEMKPLQEVILMRQKSGRM